MLEKPYQEWAPPQALKDYIDCVWTLTCPAQIKTIRIIPDGCTDLIFDLQKQVSFWGGIMTKSLCFSLNPKQDLIGIRFKAGAARSFLSCPLAELVNQNISSHELGFEDTFFIDRLLFLNETFERVNFIFNYFSENISYFSKNKIISAFLFKISDRNSFTISAMSDELGITRQYLAKIFREYIGIEPKKFFRMSRIHSLVKTIPLENLKGVNWAQCAVDFGFYDQSHLIHECKDILGVTPSEMSNEEFSFN